MAEIKIPFELGSTLWWTGSGYREEWIECSECVGSKAITMIQGNGTEVSIACACCSHGMERPSGSVKRIFYEHSPMLFVPKRVRVDGGEIMYSSASPGANAYSSIDATALFASKEECEARCKELNLERTKYEEERAVANLAPKRRDMAWSAHYWGRQVKRLEEELITCRARLAVCKTRDEKKKESVDI